MRQKYTPGSWRVCGKSGDYNIRSDYHSDGEGALLFTTEKMFHKYVPDPEESKANAYLAAAAPDMLIALRRIGYLSPGQPMPSLYLESVYTALMKAIGSTGIPWPHFNEIEHHNDDEEKTIHSFDNIESNPRRKPIVIKRLKND